MMGKAIFIEEQLLLLRWPSEQKKDSTDFVEEVEGAPDKGTTQSGAKRRE